MASSDQQPHSSTDKIRAELEALGTKSRSANATLPAAPQPAGRWRYYSLWAIAALAVNAAVVGVLHYSLNNPPAYPSPSTSDVSMEIVEAPSLAAATSLPEPAAPEPESAPVPQPVASPAVVMHPASRAGTIVINGTTHIYEPQPRPTQSSSPVIVRSSGRARSTRPAVVVSPAPATANTSTSPKPSLSTHATVAKKHAYQHFRYHYKVGSNHYGVTSLNITVAETKPVAGWPGRYRTKGTAGLEYYANSGFGRTTRKFEVLTEIQNGQTNATEISVK